MSHNGALPLATLSELLDRYIAHVLESESEYELELRLGKILDGHFKADLSQDAFQKLLDHVERAKKFERKDDAIFYEYKRAGVRTRFDANRNVLESLRKKKGRSETFTLPGVVFDLKVSLAKEVVVEKGEEVVSKNKAWRKRRIAFSFSYCRIDFTITNIGRESEKRVEIELDNHKLRPSSKDEARNEILEVLGELYREQN